MHPLTSPPHFFPSAYLLIKAKRNETLFLKLSIVESDGLFHTSQFSSKSKKNNRVFTGRITRVSVYISSLTREMFIGTKRISNKVCREN